MGTYIVRYARQAGRHHGWRKVPREIWGSSRAAVASALARSRSRSAS